MNPQDPNQIPAQPAPGQTVPVPAQQPAPAAAPAPQPVAAPQPAAPQAVPQQAYPPQQVPGQPYPPQPGQPPAAPPPPQGSKPNSTQAALQIAEIRDGLVIMNDGSFRSVIMTKSINFDLMSPEEREAVEYSYQSFLNSLYFDIQIFIRSTRVDIRPYRERLEKLRSEQENMLLALLMEDYIQFISVLASETNIMDKQFYIVVPYFSEINAGKAVEESKKLFGGLFGGNKQQQVVTINEPDLEKAKQELKNRVQSVMAGLQQIGVQAVPLDTEELIELYYDFYNPDTATRQQITDFNQLTAPVITKGVGQANDPRLDREIL